MTTDDTESPERNTVRGHGRPTRRKRARRRTWVERHQMLLGLIGGGVLVACLVYVALLTVVETLGGHPAYAISTDVKGSPNVTVSAIPVKIGSTPGVLTVQADGTVKAPTSVPGVSFLGGGGGGGMANGGWFGASDPYSTAMPYTVFGRDSSGVVHIQQIGMWRGMQLDPLP